MCRTSPPPHPTSCAGPTSPPARLSALVAWPGLAWSHLDCLGPRVVGQTLPDAHARVLRDNPRHLEHRLVACTSEEGYHPLVTSDLSFLCHKLDLVIKHDFEIFVDSLLVLLAQGGHKLSLEGHFQAGGVSIADEDHHVVVLLWREVNLLDLVKVYPVPSCHHGDHLTLVGTRLDFFPARH